jgi:hypothetical protein
MTPPLRALELLDQHLPLASHRRHASLVLHPHRRLLRLEFGELPSEEVELALCHYNPPLGLNQPLLQSQSLQAMDLLQLRQALLVRRLRQKLDTLSLRQSLRMHRLSEPTGVLQIGQSPLMGLSQQTERLFLFGQTPFVILPFENACLLLLGQPSFVILDGLVALDLACAFLLSESPFVILNSQAAAVLQLGHATFVRQHLHAAEVFLLRQMSLVVRNHQAARWPPLDDLHPGRVNALPLGGVRSRCYPPRHHESDSPGRQQGAQQAPATG